MQKVLFTIFAMIFSLAALTQVEAATSGDTSYLYVLSSTSGSLDGDTLTLKGVPTVIYFSDRPERVAGHMSLAGFIDSTVQGFSDSAPNATLSIVTDTGTQTAIIELTNIRVTGDTITSDVKILENSIPESFNTSSLFIDPAEVSPMITD